jgi:ribosomal protein S11
MFSAGKLGYKKAQRYNQVSLLALVQEVLGYFQEIQSPFNVSIVLKGFSSKRNRFVRFFINSFLKKQIISITDLTDLPYNGCRPKKLRRK